MIISDHYFTLNIDPKASDAEVKQAFRRLAKKFHPDKNPGREKTAELQFKRVIEAYKVLSDRESREAYDQTYIRAFRKSHTDNFGDDNPNRRSRSNMEYLCRMVLSELLNQNAQRALEIYNDLISKTPHFSFDQHISDGDVRDCEFLLAEAYHQRGEFSKAARLYEKVLEREKRKAYYYTFAQDIKLMLKDVYTQLISKAKHSGEIMANMDKILAMGLSRREAARIYKKVAEAYYRINDIDRAVEILRHAFHIDPKLKGAKRISEKLGFTGE